jgi:hypothetical protein
MTLTVNIMSSGLYLTITMVFESMLGADGQEGERQEVARVSRIWKGMCGYALKALSRWKTKNAYGNLMAMS